MLIVVDSREQCPFPFAHERYGVYVFIVIQQVMVLFINDIDTLGRFVADLLE